MADPFQYTHAFAKYVTILKWKLCLLTSAFSAMRSHGMLKIYHNGAGDPYFFPRNAITQRSHILANSIVPDGDFDRLNVFSDSPESTTILLHWCHYGLLPFDFSLGMAGDQRVRSLALMRAWLLGSNLQIPIFQDYVMRCLLGIHLAEEFGVQDIIQLAGNPLCHTGSKLYYLLLEVVAAGMFRGRYEYNLLANFVDREHFWEDWVTANEKRERDPFEQGADHWREYMVHEHLPRPWGHYG